MKKDNYNFHGHQILKVYKDGLADENHTDSFYWKKESVSLLYKLHFKFGVKDNG